ncbi:hypothetical protein C7B65_21585 [Phormidesmis priestleyi ULC007]|uniref:Carboxypeptidase regulatory-like domain-containing protein n=1 Tax=Phormidesmis priestleyi ULC007 TaxID=1920490 RepID=A0A2T1D7E0_9CYAN|nr:hypothetical protein [Phormidesmis priestleyi]PSB16410.1 hypothetical protein C7B65_21585 [Phormidesmis priestleyi ULC007]PZO47356.1 MAG: hypothetical protein DCF14_20265 [Phormidesmis priestleyi]
MSFKDFNYVKWGFLVTLVGSIATVLTVPDFRCSIGLPSDNCVVPQKDIELVTKTETGEALEGVKVEVIGKKGSPEPELTDSNGYAKIKILAEEDVTITLSKAGYPTQSFKVNLSIDRNQVRVIRFTKSGQAQVGSIPERPVESPKSVTPTPTPKESSISGQWVGTYTCSQGITGVTVAIDQVGNKVIADFSLYPVPENPNVPRGMARYEGDFNSTSLRMRFPRGTWINKPASSWTAFPFQGQFDEALKTFSGEIDGHRCTTVNLKRKDG